MATDVQQAEWRVIHAAELLVEALDAGRPVGPSVGHLRRRLAELEARGMGEAGA